MDPLLRQTILIYFSQKRLWPWFLLALSSLSWLVYSAAWKPYFGLVFLILFLSPLIEYFVHRYLLHFPRPETGEKHRFWHWAMDQIHYIHHEDPKQVRYVFAEAWLIWGAVFLNIGIGWLLTWTWEGTMSFLTVTVLYYLLYEWTHWLAHSDYTPRNPYSRFMKKFHVWHHYKHESYWFGITSPCGDWLFRSWPEPKAIAASEMALKNRGRV